VCSPSQTYPATPSLLGTRLPYRTPTPETLVQDRQLTNHAQERFIETAQKNTFKLMVRTNRDVERAVQGAFGVCGCQGRGTAGLLPTHRRSVKEYGDDLADQPAYSSGGWGELSGCCDGLWVGGDRIELDGVMVW